MVNVIGSGKLKYFGDKTHYKKTKIYEIQQQIKS
jgi:hypothetical protein